jgi:hypothetical protein
VGELRWRVEACVAAIDRTSRSDAGRKVRVAPGSGGRSTGEVYMHIVFANFYLLSIAGPKMPADLKQGAAANFPQYSDAPFATTQEGCSAPPAKSPETGNGKNASCTGLLVA